MSVVREIKRKRNNRSISQTQKQTLLKYLKMYPVMIGPKSAKAAYGGTKESARKWMDLSQILNRLPGARKSWKAWRKTWHDVRHGTHLKYRQKKEYLSETDIDILKLIGRINSDDIIKTHGDDDTDIHMFDADINQVIENLESVIKQKAEAENSNINDEILFEVVTSSPESNRKTLNSFADLEDHEFKEINDSQVFEVLSDSTTFQSYHNKKLILLARMAKAKERSADAKERIAHALERLAEASTE